MSLSFLVDDLVVRRGGIAPNIAFGLAQLGLRPGAGGCGGRRLRRLPRRGWSGTASTATRCTSARSAHTARFVCTTDNDLCQIASFYAGAMSEARNIELPPVADRVGGLDLVLISPNDPVAMVRHSQECRERGYAFVADPSQQLARMDGDEVRS